MKRIWKTILAAGLLSCALAAVQAQDLAGVRVRADDVNLWHFRDNPALLGFREQPFMLGAAYSSVDGAGAATPFDFQAGTWSLGIITPLVNYLYATQDGLQTNWVGNAIPLGGVLSFGYAYAWGTGVVNGGQSHFGLVLRPIDFASLGATLSTDGGTPLAWGFGLALRPLVFDKRWAPLLSLTADAHLQNGVFTMESVGARIFLFDTLALRGWYDFVENGVGVEVGLSFGWAEEHAAAASVTTPDRWTVGQAVGFPAPERQTLTLGNRVLALKDIDAISHGSGSVLPGFLTSRTTVSFRGLIDMIDRAAADNSVRALVIENLPSLGGRASVQEFTRALAAFRRAGKKVYLYAVDFPNSFQFQGLAAEADWIAVSPTGIINLTGQYGRGIYLKEFLDRIGIGVANIATGKTKNAGNTFSETHRPEEDKRMITRYLGDLQAQALEALARGRGARLKKSPEEILAAGPYLLARKALEAGIIDGLQYQDEFEALVRQDFSGAVLITSYPPPREDSWGPSLFTKKVAIVHLNGTIVSGRGGRGSSIGTMTADLLKSLREDPGVAAILLRVNSPGGTVNTSDQIAHQVQLTVGGGKPVVVSMGDVAVSGGYYISADATRIFAQPGTLTGSIGVVTVRFNIAATLAKLGIHTDKVALSESSGAFDMTEEFRKRDLALNEEQVRGIYDQFVAVVARGRRLETARVLALGNGQVWTGREALAHSLVDELGGLPEARAWLVEKLGGRVEFQDYYPGPVSLFARIFGTEALALLQAVFGDAASDGLAALEAAAAPYAREVLDLLSLGNGPLFYCDQTTAGD